MKISNSNELILKKNSTKSWFHQYCSRKSSIFTVYRMCRALNRVNLTFEICRGSEHTTLELLHSPQSQDQFPSHRHPHHQYPFSCQALLSTLLWFQKLETLKMWKNALSFDCTGRKLPCSLPLITWLLVYKTAGHSRVTLSTVVAAVIAS